MNPSQKLFIQATVSSKKFHKEIEYEFNYTSFSEVKSVQARFDINYKMLTLVINTCIFNGVSLTDDP